MYKNRRLLVVLGFLLGFCSGIGGAQSTVVSVTAVDQSSQVWINGTISYKFQGVPNFSGQYQWNGATLPSNYLSPTLVPLNGSGFATFTLPTSSLITPAGSSWTYTICPNATSPCVTTSIPTTGSTQDISSTLTSVMVSPVVSSQIIPRAYTDPEIVSSIGSGQMYFNTANNVYRVNVGTPFAVNWQNISTGSGGTGVVVNPTASQLIVQPTGTVFGSNNFLVNGTTGSCGLPGSFFAGVSCDQINALDQNFIYETTPPFVSEGHTLFSTGPGGGTSGGRVDSGVRDFYVMNNQGQHYAHERFNFVFGVGDTIPEDTVDYMHAGMAYPSDQGFNGEYEAGGQDPGYFHATIATGGTGAQTLIFTSNNGSGCNPIQGVGICYPSALSMMIDMSSSHTANITGTAGLAGQSVAHLGITTVGSGQTNGTYAITSTGGTCSQQPTASIVISGGVITSAAVTKAGGPCATAPTFTVAEGGTPGTLISSLGYPVALGQVSQLPTNGTFPITHASAYKGGSIGALDTTPDAPVIVTISGMTGAVLNGVSNMLAPGVVCVVGSNFWQTATITAVTGTFSSQNVTLGLVYPMVNPTIWQGGPCGDDISFDTNFSVFNYRTSYPAIYSIFGNDLGYSVPGLGGMNNQIVNIPQTGAEPETADGGANSGIHLYCAAIITNNGAVVTEPGGQPTVTTLSPKLMPNTCTWPVSGAVEDPDFPLQNVIGKWLNYNMSAAANGDGQESAFLITLSGMGMAFTSYGMNIQNTNPFTVYTTYNMVPPSGAYVAGGAWQYGLFLGTAPSTSILHVDAAFPGLTHTRLLDTGFAGLALDLDWSTNTLDVDGGINVGGNAVINGSLTAGNLDIQKLQVGTNSFPGEVDFSVDGVTAQSKFKLCNLFGFNGYVGFTQGTTADCGITFGGYQPDGILGTGYLEVDASGQINNLVVALPPPVGIPVPVVACTGTCHDSWEYWLTDINPSGQEGQANLTQNVFILAPNAATTLSGSNTITLTCPTALQYGYPAGTTYMAYGTNVSTPGNLYQVGICPVGSTLVDTGAGTVVSSLPTNGGNANMLAGGYYMPSTGPFRIFRNVHSTTTDSGFSFPSPGVMSIDGPTPGDGLGTIVCATGCGGGGGGAVSSVSNSDGTATISPTTGAVVVSVNVSHPNTWTGQQSGTTPTPTDNTTKFATTAFVQANKTSIAGVTTTLTGSSLAGGATESVCGTVSGAIVGSPVPVSASDGSLQPVGILELGRVPTTNQVCVYRQNVTVTPITTTSITYNFTVSQ